MTADTELEQFELSEAEADELDENRLYYFYDDMDNYHQLRYERGDMPDDHHSDLVDDLKALLLWLFHGQEVTVQREFNFYETDDQMEKPLYPDMYVMKRRKEPGTSYHLGVDGPPPDLIIEVMSTKTRLNDIGPKPRHKPQRYAKWGVKEYFVYDPRKLQRRKKGQQRLWGWRLQANGKFAVIEAEADGRMWSEELKSWLVPAGVTLKLYDRDGNLRLKKEEYEEQEKNKARQEILLERFNRETAQRRAETERQAKEAAQQRAAKMAAKLKELGFDPNDL